MASKASARYAREPHWHCCRQCRQRYEDTCAHPENNARCNQCRLGNGWLLLREGRLPRDCCVLHSYVLARTECQRLKLVGPDDWWLCRVCHRIQGYSPAIRVYPLDHKEST